MYVIHPSKVCGLEPMTALEDVADLMLSYQQSSFR